MTLFLFPRDHIVLRAIVINCIWISLFLKLTVAANIVEVWKSNVAPAQLRSVLYWFECCLWMQLIAMGI